MGLMKKRIEELKNRRAHLELGGGPEKIKAQHRKDKLSCLKKG